jgi:GTP:adenosylcobinamide-phosphate guanylyltransferase
MDVTCAMLAGGRSARMGRNKPTLKVCDKTLVQQACEKGEHTALMERGGSVFINITVEEGSLLVQRLGNG